MSLSDHVRPSCTADGRRETRPYPAATQVLTSVLVRVVSVGVDGGCACGYRSAYLEGGADYSHRALGKGTLRRESLRSAVRTLE
jgi:hypothetical protein